MSCARVGPRFVAFPASLARRVRSVLAGGSARSPPTGRRTMAITRKAALPTPCNAITDAKTYQGFWRWNSSAFRRLSKLVSGDRTRPQVIVILQSPNIFRAEFTRIAGRYRLRGIGRDPVTRHVTANSRRNVNHHLFRLVVYLDIRSSYLPADF